MTISPSLLLCGMSGKFVDEALIDAFAGQCGNERVAENVKARQHLPLRIFHQRGERLVSLSVSQLDFAVPKQVRFSLLYLHPGGQDFCEQLADRDTAGGVSASRALLLAERDDRIFRIHVLQSGAHHLGSSGPGVCGHHQHRVDVIPNAGRLGELQKLGNFT